MSICITKIGFLFGNLLDDIHFLDYQRDKYHRLTNLEATRTRTERDVNLTVLIQKIVDKRTLKGDRIVFKNVESESKVLSIGISVIMLNLGIYLGVPAVVIVEIRRKF